MRAPLERELAGLRVAQGRPGPDRPTVRLSATLSSYLARQVTLGIGTALFGLALVALVIDAVELLRRSSGHPNITIATVFLMAGLHLPFLVQKLTPFAVLFGSMLSFLRLTRSHELVAARVSGVSIWQFLFPALAVAFLLGVFMITAFNPLAAATSARYERLDQKYLSNDPSLTVAAPGGLWLRQVQNGDELLIHARQMSQNPPVLQHVMVVSYKQGVHFAERIDARLAQLGDGSLTLVDPLITRPDGTSEMHNSLVIATDLTPERIQESFTPPGTLSFWDLPSFIHTLEEVGVSARQHRLYWQGLVAMPLFLCAMLLIGTTFSLRLARRGGTGLLATVGVVTGFALYILSDVVFAVGLSGRLPVILAAWTPAGIAVLLGLTSLLHLEDG